MRYLLISLVGMIVASCGSIDKSTDKTLFSNVSKLQSPEGNFILYRYLVAGPMAFNKGHTEIRILESTDTLNFNNDQFFRFDKNPFSIKWISRNSILVKCFIDDTVSSRQPVKSEIKKWGVWDFKIEYYSMCSTGSNPGLYFDYYSILRDTLIFTSSKQQFFFNIQDVEISLDTNRILINHFEIDSTNCSKIGLSLTQYEFRANKEYNRGPLLKIQAFVKSEPYSTVGE